MMRAVDNSTGLIVDTYKKLGIWDDTLVILSADSTSLLGRATSCSLGRLGSQTIHHRTCSPHPRLRCNALTLARRWKPRHWWFKLAAARTKGHNL